VWVDADAASLIERTVLEQLSQEEKRVINFVAEYAKINVTEVFHLT
jgi:uncharacterized protein YaiI (UPF0178 family)